MKIIGKSKLDETQLNDRKVKGVNAIEVYTDTSLFSEPILNYGDMQTKLKNAGLKVCTVHSPMNHPDGTDICIGSTEINSRQENFNYHKKTIDLAASISNVENPVVVVHAGGRFKIDNYNSENFIKEKEYAIKIFVEDLYEINEYLNKNYPYIIVGVENMSALIVSKNKNKDIVYSPYGSGFELLNIVKGLKLPNIKLVLDICHAQSVCTLSSQTKNRITINEFIREYLDTNNLCLVHLNNIIGLGETQEKHGTPFTNNKKDKLYLDNVIKSLEKANYNGYITLEIYEENIDKAINMRTTIDTITELGYSKYLL